MAIAAVKYQQTRPLSTAGLAGMICPHIVDWSMLLGAILAFGVMWPAIAAKAGAGC